MSKMFVKKSMNRLGIIIYIISDIIVKIVIILKYIANLTLLKSIRFLQFNFTTTTLTNKPFKVDIEYFKLVELVCFVL